MELDTRAQDILRVQSQMETERSNWDTHWREIAQRVLPRQDTFRIERFGGEKRTERIFDSTAVLALDRAASAIDSLITPQTQQWHGLEPEDEKLRDNREVMLYLADLAKLLFRIRYRPIANFASQAHECYVSLMAFGTLGMFVDDIVGIGIRYKSIALSQLYILENHAGIIDYVHRKFKMTARQAVEKFGPKTPETIVAEAKVNPLRKYDFIHCVRPNEDRVYGALNHRGMHYSSIYLSIQGKKIVQEGGYRVNPYLVSRHVTAPDETYGRSPAMMVLPDIKMINEMEKTTIRAAHKVVDPPLLAFGDGVLNAFSTRPNAINYGGVDERGNQLIHPLKTGANLPIVFEMSEQKRKLINDAFYVTLFQILVQNPQMTATEALIRAQEKGQLLAPTVGRQQSEFLGPLIQRELDILAMAGALPQMPFPLLKAGGMVRVTYTSPLARLRRAEDGVAISRTIELLSPLAQAKPDIFDVFDEVELAYEIADINNVPLKVIKPREVLAAEKAQKMQNAQQQIDAQNANTAAQGAKNLGAAAQSLGFTAPAEVPQP